MRQLSGFHAVLQVDLEVGEVDERGLRGVKAVRDMVEGQVAVKIPRVLGAVMGDWNRTSEVGFQWADSQGASDGVHHWHGARLSHSLACCWQPTPKLQARAGNKRF